MKAVPFAAREAGRLPAWKLHRQGWSQRAIARLLEVGESTVSRLRADSAGRCRVEVSAGAGVSPAALNFLLTRGLQEQLTASRYRFALPITELQRWKDNSAGRGTFSRPGNGGWAYDAAFSGGDRWAFPRFALPQEVDLTKVKAVLVRVRCMAPSTVRIMTWDAQGRDACTAFPIIKPDGQWHVALVPLDSFLKTKAGEAIGWQVREISVGLNSEADANRLEVSDLYLVGDD